MKRTIACALVYLAGGMAWWGGCSRQETFSKDPKVATRQLTELVPTGASETRARKSLSDRGFKFSSLGSDAAAERLIIGTYTTPTTMWQVGLIIIEEKVAASSVSVSDLRDKSK